MCSFLEFGFSAEVCQSPAMLRLALTVFGFTLTVHCLTWWGGWSMSTDYQSVFWTLGSLVLITTLPPPVALLIWSQEYLDRVLARYEADRVFRLSRRARAKSGDVDAGGGHS